MKVYLTNTLFLFFSLIMGYSQSDPLWMRYPAISPDGQNIVFAYKGDLYKVPSQGGLAYPITLHEAYERNPVWSPDGQNIAFASNRYGNFDVFTMPANGGADQRLTYHSAGDYPSTFTADGTGVLFTSSRLDQASNQQFPSSVLPELYQISTKGGMPKQLITTPAMSTQVSKDGKHLLYHDRKGYEDAFRKHHTSSVTRDIWMYDQETGAYQQLSSFEGEDRNPVFAPDEKGMYFLSEAGNGVFNVYYQAFDGSKKKRQLTNFDTHPVRYLSISDDGLMCFSQHGELYTMKDGQVPKKVAVNVGTGARYNESVLHKVNKASELELSPNGKEIAFIHRGEVFVSSVAGGTTRQITNTPEQERSVSFSPDGRSLLYASERDGSWDVYQSSIKREEEKYFFNATLIKEEAVVNTDKDEFQPAYSPDGKEVAYLEERTELRVHNLESKASRTILAADKNYSYSDGDQHYEWSPDGKWFLVEYMLPKQWRSQAGLVSASGKEEVINLSKSGYGAFAPRWMMDGEMMLWFSNRDGQKNHGGWGGEVDAYALFFTQDAYDKYRLNEEDYNLLKEQEKEAKKENEKDEKKEDEKEDKKKIKPIQLELDGIDDRKSRLTIHSSQMAGAYVDKKGENLYYLSKFEKGFDLWKTDLKTRETKILTKLNSSSAGWLVPDKEEKHLFLLAGGKVKKVELSSGKAKGIGINGEMQLKKAKEREYMFEHIWRQVDKKFYVTDLHEVDWPALKAEYARFLPHINNDNDFADMLSEMLGELNASHTGAFNIANNEKGDKTAALGLFYDWDYEGDGLKIAEVIDKGPLVNKDSKLEAGHILEKIDGRAVGKDRNLYELLNRKVDKNTLLSFYDPATGNRWEETVKPISLGKEGELRYQRWVKNCREMVDKLSDGKVGYVHVRGMNDKSYRTVYDEVLGRHGNKEALIVDTRFNGGGWLHDDLATFLSGTPYVSMKPRGQDLGSEPMNKWSKPSVVVMSESNYSDAHMFPYAYKALGIGKLVGMPVPGTATAVWWEKLHTGNIVFGIPQVGVVTNDGEYLENNQLEPDIKVPNEPGKVSKGQDQQLEAAVQELLRQLKAVYKP